MEIIKAGQVDEVVAPLCAKARDLSVTNSDEYVLAGQLQGELLRLQKLIEEYWEPMRSSAREAYDAVLAKKKAMLDPVEETYRALSKKAGDWYLADKRTREEAAEKAAKKAEKKGLPPPPEKAAPELVGAQARTSWDFEVINEAKLPREFLTPDLAKIRGVVRAMKGDTRIAGIRVYEKASVNGRTQG